MPPGNCSLIDGVATQLPQGTGWASTFNLELAFRAGVAIADESMALNHHFDRKTVDYRTGASSVINIARDGRWGRTPETYGEDPFLTLEVATALNRALMGFEPQHTHGDSHSKPWAKLQQQSPASIFSSNLQPFGMSDCEISTPGWRCPRPGEAQP